MKLLLCGVRGSMPVSGVEFDRVGGHTSSVAIEAADGRHLVLDAGTGFTRLAGELQGRPFRGSILLTHLHWDHMHGLPFLPNADREDAETDLFVPMQGDDDALTLLSRSMSPPSFPITPTGLRGSWGFHSIDEGPSNVEDFEILAAEISHKGGRTFGYRITSDAGSLAYLPDHAPNIASPAQLAGARQVASGVDLLLHGGQFVESERHLADAYGHATIDDAIAFAAEAGVGRLVLLHHSPARTDQAIEALIGQHCFGKMSIVFGREGDRFVVEGRE